MLKRLLFIFALAILALPCASWAATYYVAPVATGAEDGSTVTDAGTITTILNGVDFADGDVVIMKSEVAYTTTLTLAATVAGNGVSGLTIRGSEDTDGDWGDGTKDADTAKPWWNADTTKPATVDGGSTYKLVNLTFSKLNFKGQDWATTYKGHSFYLYRINGLTMTACDADGSYNFGGTHGGHNAYVIQNPKGAVVISGGTIQKFGSAAVIAGTSASGSNDDLGLIIWLATAAGTTVSIHDMTFDKIGGDAIQLYQSTAQTTIYNIVSTDNGENALDIKGASNVKLYHSDLSRPNIAGVAGDGISAGNLVHIHNNGSAWPAENIEIYKNKLHTCPEYAGIAVFSGDISAPTSNIRIHSNWIEGCRTGISNQNTNDVVNYRNIVVDPSSTGYFFSVAYTSGFTPAPASGYAGKFYGNTCVARSNITAGVYAGRSLSNYFLLKNNAFYLDGTGYLVQSYHADKPEFDTNIFYSTGSQDIIDWNGTAYDETELAGWEADAGVQNNIFSDPQLADVANGQFWAASGSAPISNTALDTWTSEIADTVNGLVITSVWSSGGWSITELSGADNGGRDIGAYELPEDIPPPPIGGAAPSGTYTFAYNADYTADTDEAWTASGTGNVGGTVAAGVEIAGAYGSAGNGVRFSAADENIKWEVTVGPDEMTIWGKITPESLNNGNSVIWHLWQDASNHAYAYFRNDGLISMRYEAQDAVVIANSTVTLSTMTEVTVGFRASATTHCNADATGCLSIKIGANDWENDADAVAVGSWAAGTRYFYLGESDQTTVGLVNPWQGDEWSIVDSYNAAEPDWTPADSTAPTITARGVCSDGSCTACTTDLTTAYGLGDTFRVCAAMSEDVIVNSAPTWTFTCGTVTMSLDYFQKVDIGGTKYVTALATVPAKARCTDPELIEMTNYSGIVDGSANAIDPTGSAGVFSTGTITIASEGAWTVGTFTDDEENTYQGEYATMTAYRAAVAKVDGDTHTLGATTEPSALDMSGDDCTESAPCTITLEGDWTTAGVTLGDWWVLNAAGNTVSGAVTGGASNTISRMAH